jgi:hypothetical protein
MEVVEVEVDAEVVVVVCGGVFSRQSGAHSLNAWGIGETR